MMTAYMEDDREEEEVARLEKKQMMMMMICQCRDNREIKGKNGLMTKMTQKQQQTRCLKLLVLHFLLLKKVPSLYQEMQKVDQ
jgi:hypothetical protein